MYYYSSSAEGHTGFIKNKYMYDKTILSSELNSIYDIQNDYATDNIDTEYDIIREWENYIYTILNG